MQKILEIGRLGRLGRWSKNSILTFQEISTCRLHEVGFVVARVSEKALSIRLGNGSSRGFASHSRVRTCTPHRRAISRDNLANRVLKLDR